ncbi:hypothetical protein N5V81_12985 [Escherichia coli]|nr:hypothetical protein [Escherichia coli]
MMQGRKIFPAHWDWLPNLIEMIAEHIDPEDSTFDRTELLKKPTKESTMGLFDILKNLDEQEKKSLLLRIESISTEKERGNYCMC